MAMMTVEEAAAILECVYKNAPDREIAVRIHLFGIKYADDLHSLSIREVVELAGVPDYVTEIGKGRNLARYVDIKPGVELCP